ncbi:MAG: hypothetical protein H2057_01995 [Alphaproteobacteria bacterium]|nr:hypothetical protein [Alphaproteobacteria bacterium]
MSHNKIQNYLVTIFFTFCVGDARASQDEDYVEKHLNHLQQNTSVFEEKQDLESLKEALGSAFSVLTELGVESEMDLFLTQSKMTIKQWKWASTTFQATLDEVTRDAHSVVQTALPRYLTSLSTKEYHKTGKNSPRKLALKACDASDVSLAFAQKEYVISRLLSHCHKMYDDNVRLMTGGGYAADLLANLSKITTVFTDVTHFFWRVEEALLRSSIQAHKKSFLQTETKEDKELVTLWHDKKKAQALSVWTFNALNERFKLFYFSFSRLFKEESMPTLENRDVRNESRSLATLLREHTIPVK